MKPISSEVWERKLRESRAAGAAAKGTSHLKPGKEPKKSSGASDGQTPSSRATHEPAVELTVCDSLFDRKSFRTMEAAMTYMQKTYSFSVPDQEYCTDLPGLMKFLADKVSKPPHACICCNRPFPDLNSVRRHMIDKCHTHIATEARTRTGNIDEAMTDELQAELEPFYDYHGSTREITERMTPPQQIAALHRYFDSDRDGYLDKAELAKMWYTMVEGAVLSEAQYLGACQAAGADPRLGLGLDMMASLYEEGFADLTAHFAVLQDLLARRKPKAKASKKSEPPPTAEEGEVEDTEQADETAQEEQEEEDADEDSSGEGGESEDGDSDGTEYVECEDEDEFEEVMRVLGLQRVTISDTGDLRLPNGVVATNRDVQHIYKQRGRRFDQQQLALLGGGVGGRAAKNAKTPLMLTGGTKGCQVAMTQRQEERQGKRVVAFLRRRQWDDMKRGVKQNLLQTQRGQVNRTGRGDCSYGR